MRLALPSRLKLAAASASLQLRRYAALLLCGLTLAGFQLSGALHTLDNHLSASRARVVTRTPTESLVVVEIDSRSVNAAGMWPWPRTRFARAINHLHNAGANLIAFDVDFSAQSDSASDDALAASISAAPGSIVLPTFIQPNDWQENAPLESLARDAVVASVNVPIDSDGRARRYLLGFDHDGHYHHSIASVLASAPYGATGAFHIDYGVNLDRIPRLSFQDVYLGNFDPEQVRGRNIIIGATALELGDEFSTPVRPGVPGVYVHALAYESIVQGRMLVRPAPWLSLAIGALVLFLLWPRGELRPARWIVTQAVALSALLLGPAALQALTPISLDIAAALLAQALCFAVTVQRELARRAEELVRQREAHLRFAALHDPETNLANRRAMVEKIERALAAADDSVVVTIALGIDRFAMLRAAIGYANANSATSQLAAQIIKLGHCDEVFLLSTSILGVVLTAKDEAAFKDMCVPALSALDRSIQAGGQDIEVDVHVGAAVSTPGADAGRLLEQATIALDQARLRREHFVVFDEAAFPDPKAQLAITSDILTGIGRGDFSLVYQAKADARSGDLVGAESLIRWRHPELGAVAPDRFIPIAEETGAIDELTRWTLRQAINDWVCLKEAGVELPIAINLSGRLLVDTAYCAALIDAIQESGADIGLEITETAIIDDPAAALASIAAFRAAGVKVAIDDYGAGLSSLSYLKQIAADELKLDKSLIADIRTNPRDKLILKSTIDLAHSLGMSVICEGVEDDATRSVVASLGCDTIQGYLVSKPVSRDDLIRRYTAAPKAAAG